MGVEVRSHKGPKKPDLDFPVIKVKLDDLIPHEQTIPNELDWFVNSVQESQSIYWPMLIGARNHTILDGHHRAAGLKRLNYLEAPAILIDYYDDELIQLDTWYPLVQFPIAGVIDHLREKGLDVKECKVDDFSDEQLKLRKLTAYIGDGTSLYQISGDRETIFQEVRDYWLEDIVYYDDKEMCMENADQGHTSIIPWSYTKEEILGHVKNGIIHLPKTTRHTLKYNVPEKIFLLSDLERKNL